MVVVLLIILKLKYALNVITLFLKNCLILLPMQNALIRIKNQQNHHNNVFITFGSSEGREF